MLMTALLHLAQLAALLLSWFLLAAGVVSVYRHYRRLRLRAFKARLQQGCSSHGHR